MPAVRQPFRTRHLVALLLLAGLIAGSLWLVWWSGLLLRALFLPGNLQRLLHLAEVGLFVFLALDLLLLLLPPFSRPRVGVRVGRARGIAVDQPLIVGSNPGILGLRIASAQISRRHCEFAPLGDGRLTLRDLGSRNGSFVNGIDLREGASTRLSLGQRVELGRGGAVLEVVSLPPRALLGDLSWLLSVGGLLGVGLLLGGLANREVLPDVPLLVGEVSVPFSASRSWALIVALGTATAITLSLWTSAARRRGMGAPASARAVALLLVVGQVLLLPLLPAVTLRYAEAAQRAQQEVGAANWKALEQWEDAGGELSSLHCADSSWSLQVTEFVPPLPALRLPPPGQRETLCRYRQGRAALRWAANLSGSGRHPWLGSTYFRQAAILVALTLFGFVSPLLFPVLRRRIGALVDRLGAPLAPALVRGANGGSYVARALRLFAYRDVALGFVAAGLVALTLAVGSSRGRGKTLFLDLPGLPSVQTLELVKALFVLFLAGYFARQGELIAMVPRRRYLVPYLTAVVATLGLTAAQADMGGLLMLGLFLALLFLGATGSFRLLLSVPLLLMPGLALAFLAGKASILRTRLELWLAPTDHAVGEQLVQARQLLMSSGWTGYLPSEARAARIADVQGDLVLAGLAERFGLLGVLALFAAVAALGVSLLRAARAASGPRRLLLGGFAALFLVQFATQAGGLVGLLPLTGVPLPWLSQGLTASVVFTLLAALTLSVAPNSPPPPANRRPRDPMLYVGRTQGAVLCVLAALAVYWIVLLPAFGEVGALGAKYRWRDPERVAAVESAIAAGRFRPLPASDRVELVARPSASGPAAETLAFDEMAEGLRWVAGEIRPLPWLVSNPNLFADRSLTRGWLLDRHGEVLAMSDRRGARFYPQGAAVFHPIGRASGRTLGFGVEEAARPLLAGSDLPASLRLRAFAEDIHHGPDLRLTLDAELQREAFAALAGRPGGVVALALPSGELLASASSPAIDPASAGPDVWRALLQRPGNRLQLDRALRSTERYSPPGSAFKLVVAAAILTSASGFDPNRPEPCPGYDAELHVACAHGHAHGEVDLARALAVSCNIYFARAAVRLGEAELRRAAASFGLNSPSAPNLLRGVPGIEFRPAPSAVLPEGAAALGPRDLARVGYGQGPVSLTPLALARAGAVIATGGELVAPYLADSVELSRDEDGVRSVRWARNAAGPLHERVLSQIAARQIDLVLRGVFEAPGGTGRNLPRLWYDGTSWRLAREAPGESWKRVPVAGKTGSAWRSASDRTDDAWMVVWAPSGAPRVVVAVQIENGGEGGKTAGPVALAILRSALERLDRESHREDLDSTADSRFEASL